MRPACWLTTATDAHSEIYCFCTATVVTLTRINIALVRTLTVLLTFYRHRYWEDNIKMDLQEVGWGGMDWIDVADSRTGEGRL
jgi:hypothetical protein